MTEYGFVRMTYTGVRAPHHLKQEVAYSSTPVPGTEPSLLRKDGDPIAAGDAMAALLLVLKPMFESVTSFGLFEFYWHTGDPDIGDQFIWGDDLSEVGTSGGTRVNLGELVLSFKSTLGKKQKFYLMESVQPVNFRILGSALVTPLVDLSNFIIGDASFLCGQNHDFAFSCIAATSKTSDPLRGQAGLV